MINPLLLKGRFLFIVDDCFFCEIWKEFIEDINSDLRIDKRVEVIDCTNHHEFQIIDDQRIPLFLPLIEGKYPVLFFEGRRKNGTNSRAEAEAWLRAKVHNDFIFKQKNPYLFDKECEFIKKGGVRHLVCD